jgi:cell division protein FtsW
MRVKPIDRTLAAITVLLTLGGVLIFFSASLSLLPKGGSIFASALASQLILGLGGGMAALAATLFIPLQLFKRYALHVFVAAVVLCLAVFIPGLGVTANGATRWINFGITTFQPAELLKIGYVLLMARILSMGPQRGTDLMQGILPFAAVVASVLLLLQPDTDTLIIILASGVAMLFATGFRPRNLAILAGIALLCGGLLLFMRPYLLERVQTFIDPSRDPLGSGYHIQQSLIAVGSGEVWGKGFGQSVQKFTYLPEASTDAIFAVYAEEFGFIGSLMLVAGFLFFILRGLWVSARASDVFGALVTLGFVVIIGGQAFLNITAMIALIPVGGLPLPFVSHGGSALLMTLAMAGFMLSVSRTVRV